MKNRGFTIVELLIVIVVIGVLVAIVITTFTGIQERSRNTARAAVAKSYFTVIRNAAAEGQAVPVFWTGSGLAREDAVCLGEGYADLGGTSTGDCQYTSSTNYVSENSTVNAWLKQNGQTLSQYPTQSFVFGSTRYVAPILIYYPHTISGGPTHNYQMRFYLQGQNQNCGMPVLQSQSGSTPPYPYIPSPNSYSSSISSGGTWITSCTVSLENLK